MRTSRPNAIGSMCSPPKARIWTLEGTGCTGRGFAFPLHRRDARCSRHSRASSAKAGKQIRRHGYRSDRAHAAVARRRRRLPPRSHAANGRQRTCTSTTPMMQLPDAKQTKVLIVTLAKPRRCWKRPDCKPICGARASSLGPGSSIIPARRADPISPLLRRRAANELAQIDAVATHYAHRWAIVPLQAEEPGRRRALATTDPSLMPSWRN